MFHHTENDLRQSFLQEARLYGNKRSYRINEFRCRLYNVFRLHGKVENCPVNRADEGEIHRVIAVFVGNILVDDAVDLCSQQINRNFIVTTFRDDQVSITFRWLNKQIMHNTNRCSVL